eukprot:458038-Prymnesium_polylepis.1
MCIRDRAEHARDSRARKVREAARIRKENDEQRQRLADVCAVTDNSVADEVSARVTCARVWEWELWECVTGAHP